MIARLLPALAALALPAASLAQEPEPASPSEIVAAAEPEEWVAVAPEDLLLMDLAPDRDGNSRRVVIQLMPPPFSQGWVENIRTLARAGWYDGLSINRVQDNYVVQWGDPDGEDAAKAKPLPEGLVAVPSEDYTVELAYSEAMFERMGQSIPYGDRVLNGIEKATELWGLERDFYGISAGFKDGWPISMDLVEESDIGYELWPVHCYAMVGVGRNLPPDTGTGAELYAVIGHAPRHLDRNIALVGRG